MRERRVRESYSRRLAEGKIFITQASPQKFGGDLADEPVIMDQSDSFLLASLMSGSFLSLFQRVPLVPQMRRGCVRLGRGIVGLAQDYWKDGGKEEAEHKEKRVKKAPKTSAPAAHIDHSKDSPFASAKAANGLWHALPGEVSEKMWGDGFVTPGDEYITDRLIRPLGITKDMSLLDLSAGLGGRLRKTAKEFGVYIDGFEPDPDIAARGMALSIAQGRGKHATIKPYDPMNLPEERTYDCVIARETIYRVPDKQKFIASIVACCKPKAQVSFTDYIVNPEMRDQPAIVAWRAFEKDINPSGLVEMAELWAKAGISLRVHDDLTDYYKEEVKKGMVRFAKFMTSGVKPDPETKKSIEKRITTWAHRMAAMEQGMKFYRFYGIR